MNSRVRLARQTDLVSWLRQNNEPLKRAGQWWYIEGCDSLRLQGNKWYRNSTGCGGNSIDFFVDYYNLSPKEAVDRLTKDAGCFLVKKSGVKEKNINAQTLSEFDVNSIDSASDQRRILAYLIKKRGIPADIVLAQIRDRQLFQESRTGNAIFAMTNETGAIVGAEVVGTLSFDNIRFKGIKANSAGGYGYTVGQKLNPRYILFFESAIDLLSFTTIMRKRKKSLFGCLLVSMAGLKFEVIRNAIQVFGKSIATIVLCVDNDKAGNDFITLCLSQYPALIIKQPDKCFKDWNDQLLG